MTIDLWVSVALAIPLAIMANLFTPVFQRWLDNRLEKSRRVRIEKKKLNREAQLEKLLIEFAEIEKYNGLPHLFDRLLWITLLKVALYGAIGSFYHIILGFIGDVAGWDGLVGNLARLGTQITAFVVAMLVYLSCARVMRIHKKVKDFDQYKDVMENNINELGGVLPGLPGMSKF